MNNTIFQIYIIFYGFGFAGRNIVTNETKLAVMVGAWAVVYLINEYFTFSLSQSSYKCCTLKPVFWLFYQYWLSIIKQQVASSPQTGGPKSVHKKFYSNIYFFCNLWEHLDLKTNPLNLEILKHPYVAR